VAGKKGTMAYTVAYVMNKQSKHKPEAWQLISYLTGKEGMKAWTRSGFALPTRKSIAATLGYDKIIFIHHLLLVLLMLLFGKQEKICQLY